MKTTTSTIKLTHQELRDLLLSPEFQARPYHEKKEILEGFGWTEPDLLSGLQ